MTVVNLVTIVFLILMLFCYGIFVQNNKPAVMGVKEAKMNWLNLGILLLVAFIVRYILAKIDPGYETDMGCFKYWSDQVYNDGFSKFYNSETFTDYPPGYMYILWVVGFFRAHFESLADSTVLVKMPAMLCDLATGALIYKIAHKKFNEVASIVLTAFYLFNPVVLIDSAMWGQVDAVFTLFVALMVYLVAEHKLIPAYYVFAIGVLIKPQTLVLTPVLLYGILDQVILHDFNWKRFFKHLGLGLLAIAMMYVLILPYHFNEYWLTYASKCVTDAATQGKEVSAITFLPVQAEWLLNAAPGFFLAALQVLLGVVGLYYQTLTSYPYATVNGYNFWEIFKLNWHSQEETFMGVKYSTWGTLFVILLVAATLGVCILNREKKNGSKYFFLGAFIAAGFFTFSVRVHERYMFPVFMLLLCAYLYRPLKEYLFAFMGLTLIQVNNIWHAFKYYDAANFDWDATYPRVIGAFHVILFLYIIYVTVRYWVVEAKLPEAEAVKVSSEDSKKKNESVVYETQTEMTTMNFDVFESGCKPRLGEDRKKLTKKDVIAMLAITIVYAAIALFNLGDMDAPQTYWETGEQAQDTCLTFDFSNAESYPTKFSFYNGRYETRDFYLEESADAVNWTPVAVNEHNSSWGEDTSIFRMESVFCWGNYTFTQTQPYLRFRLISDRTVVNEVVFFDAAGNMVVPNNAQEYANLFDESEFYPAVSTFRDSTYFDEIYHGRTGYEMALGEYNYEWTHPPLGKVIISLGIRMFGMCPFGWRIMGTLFGIGMLPLLYLFSKKLLRETWMATLTTILFAADFMHFTQTRIATIDVFVTFFVILMYYFMYQYTRMNFYDKPLRKTFIPLLFCGISMGVGCACKWPGVYAGIGLGVIFFVTMARRYLEYRYACLNPNSETDGVKHETIIHKFKGNLIKTLAFCCVAFVLVPITIYTLSYIPFDDGQSLGLVNYVTQTEEVQYEDGMHDISTIPHKDGTTTSVDETYTKVVATLSVSDTDSFFGKLAVKWNDSKFNCLLGKMARNQKAMYDYHSNLDATHPFQSTWYEWVIAKRPIWYYTKTISGNVQENISAFGNPLVWWAGIPAFLFMLYRIFCHRDEKAMFLTIGYLAQLVPWMGVTRCTFIYHYFPSVIFVILMTAYMMHRFCDFRRDNVMYFRVSRGVCIAYVVAVVVLFAMFYPVLSGYPIDANYGLKFLRWFESWVLVSG